MSKIRLKQDHLENAFEMMQQKRQAVVDLIRAKDSVHSEADIPLLESLLEILIDNSPRKYMDFISEEQLLVQLQTFLDFLRVRKGNTINFEVFTPEDDNLDFGIMYSSILFINMPDSPFILKSLYSYFESRSLPHFLTIHPIINVERDGRGRLLSLDTRYNDPSVAKRLESFIVIQFQAIEDQDEIRQLREDICAILNSTQLAVQDFGAILKKLQEIELFVNTTEQVSETERENTIEFFRWLEQENFVFLGYRQYKVSHPGNKDKATIQVVSGAGLGILRDDKGSQYAKPKKIKTLSRTQQESLFSKRYITLDKSNSLSPVYHAQRKNMDYIGLRQRISDDEYREHVFLGLYSSKYGRESVNSIDYLRGRINRILENKKILYKTYSYNRIYEILNYYPKEDLFFMPPKLLGQVVSDLLNIISFDKVKIIPLENLNVRGQSLLLILPAMNYSHQSLQQALDIIREAFNVQLFEHRHFGSDTDAIKVYIYLVPDEGVKEVDLSQLENRIDEQTIDWRGRLVERISFFFSDADMPIEGLVRQYQHAFPESYRVANSPREATDDIAMLERLLDQQQDQVDILKKDEASAYVKIYSLGQYFLSDLIPMFQNMGMRVVEESLYTVTPQDKMPVHIHRFRVTESGGTVERVLKQRTTIVQTSLAVLHGHVANDELNALALSRGIDCWSIVMLRAYLEYLYQVGVKYTKMVAINALLNNCDITADLVRYFEVRFSPTLKSGEEKRSSELDKVYQSIHQKIEDVASIAEDYVLRRFINAIESTLRTSFYKGEAQRRVLSLKIASPNIIDIPLPKPMFEIFVYSIPMSGTHLRGGKVARGGLRWSDRPDDFRTEVLGLVNTQITKNSVIVPTGSKGGFVLRNTGLSGADARQEADRQYRNYISALLEITDNVVQGKVQRPDNVVCYDEEDAYLVVAADKGTAHLSDVANAVSNDHNFWLGDAFASGGSYGYDHKEMGVTAKGAWEAVKRHFRNLGKDIQSEPFTVVGVGDMGGDVFGNGMLLSRQIRLVAAFNHMHIFIDPDPDPAVAYKERQRMFKLQGSQWTDYKSDALSKGGGVYSRSDKKITISREAAKALGTSRTAFTPDELIKTILKAPVELLWNGGIGTYIKATHESHADVGDKANDNLRINATELRVKVLGEGGNLGVTQPARIEFVMNGGHAYTDAIDNSAGVNTSDHEVNLKILMQSAMEKGKITFDERNVLLKEMSDAVEEHVMQTNYRNGCSIDLDIHLSSESILLFQELIDFLVDKGVMDAQNEFIPTGEELLALEQRGMGIPGPILAKITSYARMDIYDTLMQSDLRWNSALEELYRSYFPPQLQEKFREEIDEHKLKKEITCTLLANKIVDQAGCTFVYNLMSTTRGTVAEITQNYLSLEHLLGVDALRQSVFALDNKKPSAVQLKMIQSIENSMRRGVRWIITKNVVEKDYCQLCDQVLESFSSVFANLEKVLPKSYLERLTTAIKNSEHTADNPKVSEFIEKSRFLADILSICYASARTERSIDETLQVYFEIKELLQVDDFKEMVYQMPLLDVWDRMARNTLIGNITDRMEEYTMARLANPKMAIGTEGYDAIINSVREKGIKNFNPLFIALRGLT
ncbi:NAD-glutamate dehydrogenase domain-containing protein [Desulfurispira natronophila]|uniref:Glutamate dehydrogenase n=1 Tax=Desulfurispira natronophila TaxID=682562 RepID=A0A7W8DHT3_9BACT|nr:NAD-glutamate dehydrogenase domain-containing protein [Desulfurispira natronophila]MBB5022682.1 glutamate dehydrogenase [Desulfurispira natronophila]